AMTHKAAKVVSDITYREVLTVHKLFALKPTVDRRGKEIIKQLKSPKINYGATVIIDESSMINEQMLKVLATTAKNKALNLVFVGDPYQLPPTKGTCTLFDGSLPTYTLTKVHRQALGNPILAKAIEYRDFINGTRDTEPTLTTVLNSKGEGIHVLDREEFYKRFVSKYIDYTAGDDVNCPLCCFTNAASIKYNDLIRKATNMLSDQLLPYYPNERMISNSSVIRDGKIALNNNEECNIISYSPTTISCGRCELLVYEVRLKRINRPKKGSAITTVYCAQSDENKKTYMKALKNRVKNPNDYFFWNDYYDEMSSIADLRLPFAGTTHKAQGSTFESIFVDKKNIDTCKSPITRAKLMYVALTRSKKDTYIHA
ncbi:MAG: AAA family ATPase, partial [Nanoarchaeota archaeon]|nr:AAA family ATPase [Nanoarchaeota archaeon]